MSCVCFIDSQLLWRSGWRLLGVKQIVPFGDNKVAFYWQDAMTRGSSLLWLTTALFKSDITLTSCWCWRLSVLYSCASQRARILSARPVNPTASCYLKTSLSVGENRGVLVESLKTSEHSWGRGGVGGLVVGGVGVGGRGVQDTTMSSHQSRSNCG